MEGRLAWWVDAPSDMTQHLTNTMDNIHMLDGRAWRKASNLTTKFTVRRRSDSSEKQKFK